MILSFPELIGLIEAGVINADLGNVNGDSIDLTLGDSILIENPHDRKWIVDVDLASGETPDMREVKMDARGYTLSPGEFVLARSREGFSLPSDISGEYRLKSSLARAGLAYSNAGWCGAGWRGSALPLGLKNMTRGFGLTIKPGMKCGQIVFRRHAPVPDHASYAVNGRDLRAHTNREV